MLKMLFRLFGKKSRPKPTAMVVDLATSGGSASSPFKPTKSIRVEPTKVAQPARPAHNTSHKPERRDTLDDFYTPPRRDPDPDPVIHAPVYHAPSPVYDSSPSYDPSPSYRSSDCASPSSSSDSCSSPSSSD